jgi:valyl-tRNA synthetase
VTAAWDDLDYARALERTEQFFWSFTDDYLELVKARAYGRPDGATPAEHAATESARAALATALDTLLRLFAPVLPFATEEVWSWWREGSVHRAAWPEAAPLRHEAADADQGVLDMVAAVLGDIRRAKTEAKRSLRTEVESIVVRDTPERLARLDAARRDLIEAGHVGRLDLLPGEAPGVDVTLAADGAA